MIDKDLQYALDNGIIDSTSIQSIVEMTRRKELLDKHPYKMWESADGKWHTYLPDKEKGRVPRKRNSQKELEDVIVNYWREQEENPRIDELFKEWNNSQLENGYIKINTALRNESLFKRHFTEFGKNRIKNVSIDMWVEFLEAQIPKFNLTAKSFSGLRTVTRGIIKLAKRKKLINFNVQDLDSELIIPKKGFFKRYKKDWEEVYNVDETALILEYCKENPDIWSSCIELIFVTGLRVGEAIALKHDDIDPIHPVTPIEKTPKGVNLSHLWSLCF